MKRWLFWKLTLAPNYLQERYPDFVSEWIYRHMIMCQQDWDFDPTGSQTD